MKIDSWTKPTPAFTPFALTLHVESQQDADVLYFLFNYSPLCDGLDMHGIAQQVRNFITGNGGKADGFYRIRKSVEAAINKLFELRATK